MRVHDFVRTTRTAVGLLAADDMDLPICRYTERSSLTSSPVRLVVRMMTSSNSDDSSPELLDGPRLLRVGLVVAASGSLLVALAARFLFEPDGARGGLPRSS